MRRAKGVVWRLLAPRKAGNAAFLPQPAHGLAPPGEDFVGVGLVADVPHQPVFRGVEHGMQRDGEFHCAEVGRQMPAGARHRLHDELA